MRVQFLTSLAHQLIVALNTYEHHHALKLLTAILEISFESITKNGGIK